VILVIFNVVTILHLLRVTLPIVTFVMTNPSKFPSIDVDQRSFIERVLQRTGWTITELARRAQLDHSTLSRFLGGGRDGHALRHSTVRKIEQASGIGFLATGKGQGILASADGFSESEATPIQASAGNALPELIQAALRGRGAADPWLLKSKALENVGYKPGDTLIVELGLVPQPNDIVCAQIYDWQRGGGETVFRIYQPPYLLAACNDPALMRPHLVDDSAVIIKGVVTLQFRERPHR
jgi:transcriptional regulator with XRE-family HTH domain